MTQPFDLKTASVPFIEFPDDHGREDNGPFFSISNFGDGIRRRPERANVHRHDFFEIFFFVEGSGRFFSDFEFHELVPGTLLFVSPGQIHGWPDIGSLKGFSVFFGTSFFTGKNAAVPTLFEYPFFFSRRTALAKNISQHHLPNLSSLLSRVASEWQSDGHRKSDIIRALLEIYLIECERIYIDMHGSEIEPSNSLVRSFVILVERYYRHRWTLHDYAKKLGVTQPTLIKFVKERMGRTPHDLLTERMTLESKRLLLDSTKKITEVAHYLGFDDVSNFAKFVQSKTGFSPVQLREVLQNGESVP